MSSDNGPLLYGFTNTNTNRTGGDLWGKNQFNSTFPLSLCFYMRANRMPPVSVKLREGGKITASDSDWSIEDVIGSTAARYNFESIFQPYSKLSRNAVEKIDLVVSIGKSDWRPLEIKLTVVPDNTTQKKEEIEWGPEIVLRPVSTAYAMMGLANSLWEPGNQKIRDQVLNTIKPVYDQISANGWDNSEEIKSLQGPLVGSLQNALNLLISIQKPYLVQPIWKTEGQSPLLCEHCFDVFVWSDAAVLQISVDNSPSDAQVVTRHLREVARHVRSMHDILSGGNFDYNGIYKGMALGKQTDKAFALSGKNVREYLRHPRLDKPILEKDVLKDLIQNGGDKMLRPERRFDATVVTYFHSQRD